MVANGPGSGHPSSKGRGHDAKFPARPAGADLRQVGDKASAAAVLEQQHAIALAALDPALRGATQQLWDLQAAAKASDQVKTDASSLMGGVDSAFSALQQVVSREKTALQTVVDAHQDAVTKLTDLSQSLHSALDSYKSADQTVNARAMAQAEIKADLAITKAGGSLSDDMVASLKKALTSVTQESSDQFSSSTDYLRDMYETQNDISGLASVTDSSLAVEQQALDAAKAQLTALDTVLSKAQEQVDIAKGQSTTLLSIDQAMQALGSAILSATANPVNAATAAVGQAYQGALGRAPDAAGLAFWQQQAAAGVSVGDIQSAITMSPEATIQGMYETLLHRPADAAGLQYWLGQYAKGVSFADIGNAITGSREATGTIPGFAGGGDFGGGWRLVGENGPELEATGPSRIFNASQTSDLFARLASPSSNNDALVAEVKAMREEIQALAGRCRGTALSPASRRTSAGSACSNSMTAPSGAAWSTLTWPAPTAVLWCCRACMMPWCAASIPRRRLCHR